MPKTRPPYPAEFRQQIVKLARAGRTPAETRGGARALGFSATTACSIALSKLRSATICFDFLFSSSS